MAIYRYGSVRSPIKIIIKNVLARMRSLSLGTAKLLFGLADVSSTKMEWDGELPCWSRSMCKQS
jgi:hypothetical protein